MIDPMAMQQIMANAQRFQQFQQQFGQFAQQFQGGGQPFDGRGQVMQMLQNGQMSQADFEQCRQWANQMTGTNY